MHDIHCKVVTVDDNNDIDRVVSEYKPTHVIIEALWVVPSKFEVLCALHPKVQWIVRLHSKGPFLSTEGIATEWVEEYIELADVGGLKINVALNNEQFCEDLSKVYDWDFLYLPNIYAPHHSFPPRNHKESSFEINIGCFGASRPHKNQFEQAIAAIIFANSIGKTLRFHMNSSELENNGNSILKNIQNLFNSSNHELILHKWMPHEKFVHLVRTMDIGMQVSFSESFCIVAADFAANNVPIIVSPDVTWMPKMFQADTTNTKDIVSTLKFAHTTRNIPIVNDCSRHHLEQYNRRSTKTWLEFI